MSNESHAEGSKNETHEDLRALFGAIMQAVIERKLQALIVGYALSPEPQGDADASPIGVRFLSASPRMTAELLDIIVDGFRRTLDAAPATSGRIEYTVPADPPHADLHTGNCTEH